ncbi:MAG: hypothetical protein ACPGU4_13245, partial [Flavobacteriales bacterium]
ICLKLCVSAKVANKVSSSLDKQIPPLNQPKRHTMGVKPGIGTVLQRYNKNSDKPAVGQVFFDEQLIVLYKSANEAIRKSFSSA